MTRTITGFLTFALLMLPLLVSRADASLIVYKTQSGNQERVMVMDDTGANPIEVYRAPKFAGIGDITISPAGSDGTWIAMDLYEGLVKSDGTGLVKVLCSPGTDADNEEYYLVGSQRWSSDGTEILVYTGDYLGLIPADFTAQSDCRSPLVPIYEHDWAMAGSPAWNDDVSKIAFFEETGEQFQLVILDRETGWMPTVVGNPLPVRARGRLDWQRGGDLLVFSIREDLGPHSFVWWLNWIDSRDGTWGYFMEGASRLEGLSPSWSPDGLQLVFTDKPGGNLIKWNYPDGPGEVMGSGDNPDWQRDALPSGCESDSDCLDGNPCTDDSCVDSACVHDPVTDGSSPAGCDGECWDGVCVIPECEADIDCTDDSDICTIPVCRDAGHAWAYCDFEVLPCGADDGCCPLGCGPDLDIDCPICLPSGAACTTDSECCSRQCHRVKGTCK